MTVQSSIHTRGFHQSRQPSARGVCFWYEAVHVSKARASQRYRIGNLVELVRGSSAITGRPFPAQLLGRTRSVCCLRPLVDQGLAPALDAMRRAGIRLVADYDDLIFAGDVSGVPAWVGERLKAYASGPQAFDAITVSTRALARHAAALAPDKPVTVVPNGLSESWVRHGHALYSAFRPGDPLVIRYLCGSPSHDADFASILPPLVQFLREHPDVRLEVAGPVTFDASGIAPAQFQKLPLVPFDELPRLLATSWVTLAPLLPTAFNECKSAIKFLESAAFSCPTLASPNDDLLRHQELGAPLALCSSEHDWYERLSSLLDMERRMSEGQRAAHYVAAHGMARSSLSAWLGAIDEREER